MSSSTNEDQISGQQQQISRKIPQSLNSATSSLKKQFTKIKLNEKANPTSKTSKVESQDKIEELRSSEDEEPYNQALMDFFNKPRKQNQESSNQNQQRGDQRSSTNNDRSKLSQIIQDRLGDRKQNQLQINQQKTEQAPTVQIQQKLAHQSFPDQKVQESQMHQRKITKPQEMIKKQDTIQKPQIFQGLRAAFCKIGREMSEKRVEILIQQFREHGGKVLMTDLLNEQNSLILIEKLDFIICSRRELAGIPLKFKTLSAYLQFPQNSNLNKIEFEKKISEIFSNLKVVNPEWLTKCLMEKRAIKEAKELEPYLIPLDIPTLDISKLIKTLGDKNSLKRHDSTFSDSKSAAPDEEEKLDKVVSLDEIIDDVYKFKFANGQETWSKRKAQKRGFDDITKDTTEDSLPNPNLSSLLKSSQKQKVNDSDLNETQNQQERSQDETLSNTKFQYERGDDQSSHRSFRSKFYKDGEELYSEDSYLHQWKPNYVANREEYWDKKKDMFACARGSTLKENQFEKDGVIYNKPEEQKEESKDQTEEEEKLDEGENDDKQNLIEDASIAGTEDLKKKPMNEEIIKQIEMLYKYYEAQGDQGRMHGYRRGLTFLRSYKQPIYSVEQLEEVPYLGKGILKKIKELLEEGSIKRFKFLSHDESVVVTELFEGVWGVGPKLAQKLYKQGFRTIDDLRQNQSLLNTNQKVGLKYYEDFSQRIPRDEVTLMLNKIRVEGEKIFSESKEQLLIQACGSYRRGKQSCGDIDILITKKDGSSIYGMVEKLVIALEKDGFLQERLGGLRHSHTGSEGYMGVCQFKPDLPHRRIDIKAYPLSQYGFALLYFTGSGNFNRSMRLFAQKKGYSLSDYGLTPVIRVKGEKVAEFQSLPCQTEEDVFKALNLEYKAPHEREI